MPELTMPRLSDTMQEGTISRWLKKQGERVERGEIVAEIETDKATMELEAFDAGVIEQILVEEGQTVPIGQAIAVVGTGGGNGATEQRSDGGTARSGGEAATAPTDPAEADPRAQQEAEREKPATAGTGDEAAEGRERGGGRAGERESTATAGRDGGDGAAQQPPAQAATAPRQAPAAPRAAPPADEADDDQVRASPMARAIARERGLDLRTIRGSGPGGRIIRADVEAAAGGDGRAAAPTAAPTQPTAESPPAQPAAAAPQPAAAVSVDDVEEIPLTNMRRVIARRMVESVQNAPHFYLVTVVDAEALVQFRAELNQRLASGGDDLKLTLNDLLVKACATAIRANPDVNVAWMGDKILRHRRIHVGVAVPVEGGLLVPVIRDADQKSVGQISREARALIDKARAGRLTPQEYSGGTFTISNLGMFGIDHFTAVINSPEAAILAVGAANPEPVVRDGQVVVRHTMKLTLSIDHRALDGASGARFLQQLKAILEEPLRIVV